MIKVFVVFILIINIYGFVIMFSDKNKARKKQWRVPEAKLFSIAFLFGSLGILLGMAAFRHKTKHLKFVLGVPVILIVQIFLLFKFMLS